MQIQKLQSYEDNQFIDKKIHSKNFVNIFDEDNLELSQFKMIFKMGFDQYKEGKWMHAKKFFERA